MTVLSCTVLHCEPDQSNFEVGKRETSQKSSPAVCGHNRDGAFLAGAGAEGRRLQISTSSFKKHTSRLRPPPTHTHCPTHLRKTHSLKDTNVFLPIHTRKLHRTD